MQDDLIISLNREVGELKTMMTQFGERQERIDRHYAHAYANHSRRLRSLENLRGKLYAVAGTVGVIASASWEIIKNYLPNFIHHGNGGS